MDLIFKQLGQLDGLLGKMLDEVDFGLKNIVVKYMKTIFAQTVKIILIYTVLCVSLFLMLRTMISYTSFRGNESFLALKQEYIHIKIWMYSFYIHVFTSIFCLVAGMTQFSTSLRLKNPQLHRQIGKIYVYSILLINFPVALVMAYYANGFLPSKIAFFILDILWFWFTLKAVIEIKRKNVQAHQNFMIRSYALTFSAITLRTWKIVISSLIEIDPETLYMIDAWLGFVPNLIIAELLIRKRLSNKLSS